MERRIPYENKISYTKYKQISVQLSLDSAYFENKKMAEDFACPFCLLIPNPQSAIEHISCGRIFCKECINRWIRTKKKSNCPACNINNLCTNIRTIKTDSKAIYRILNSLIIRCPSPKDAVLGECQWKDEWGKLDNHLEKCDYKLLYCTLGCGALICRKKMDEHEIKLCPNMPKLCKFCGQYFYHRIEDHEDYCSQNPDRIAFCEFQLFGCQFKGKKSDMQKHDLTSKDAHLELSKSYIKKLAGSEEEKAESNLENYLKNGTYFPTCPKNHPLLFLREYFDIKTYKCVVCEDTNIPISKGVFLCENCNWHCCPKCYSIPYIGQTYKFPVCPKKKQHIMVKLNSKEISKRYCFICKKELLSDIGGHWCVYCGVAICSNCWMLNSSSFKQYPHC